MAALAVALPIVLGVVGVGASIIGGMAEANSARANGEATSAAELENADIAGQNKIITDSRRQIDVSTAEADAADSERSNRRNLASIRNAFGGSGTGVGGSPLDAMLDVATTASRDTSRIRQEGQQRNRESVLQILGYQKDQNSAIKRAKFAKEAAGRGVLAAGINTVTRLTRLV